MRFFFDNCISFRIAQALAILDRDGHTIMALCEKFDKATPDEIWMPILGEEGDWVVITGDKRIHRSPHLRSIWNASRITTFFQEPAWMGPSFDELQKASKIIGFWTKIVECSRASHQGTALSLSIRGKIDRL